MIVNHLKLSKAPEHDGLLAEMLQACYEHIIVFLVTLFNKVFYNREYTKAWSGATIVILFKTGEQDSPDNNRYGSLIITVSKMYSNSLNLRLTKRTEENGMTAEVAVISGKDIALWIIFVCCILFHNDIFHERSGKV